MTDGLDDAWLPRDNGELVFDALGENPQRPYYESRCAAREAIVVDLGLSTSSAIDAAAPTDRGPV